jgi:hypothetical protein
MKNQEESNESENNNQKDNGHTMEPVHEEGKDQPQVIKRDPLTFIIWGVLLIAYGLIQLVFGFTNQGDMYSNTVKLIQPILLLTLGGVSFLYGYRRNKKIKVIAVKK